MKKLFAVAILAALATGAAYASGWIAVYALIDKVVLEPNAEKPERIQIWGVFRIAAWGGGADAPARGYLYLTVPPSWAGSGKEVEARKEWNDLKSVAGKRQVVAFGEISFGGESNPDYRRATVRKADQKPEKPDPYDFGTGVVTLRSDTEYGPVKSLLEFH